MVMIYNCISSDGDFADRWKIGEETGVTSGHTKSRRGKSGRRGKSMRDKSTCFEGGDIMLENREYHDWTTLIIDGVKLIVKNVSPSSTIRRQLMLSILYLRP